jgi:hypothetical protein
MTDEELRGLRRRRIPISPQRWTAPRRPRRLSVRFWVLATTLRVIRWLERLLLGPSA